MRVWRSFIIWFHRVSLGRDKGRRGSNRGFIVQGKARAAFGIEEMHRIRLRLDRQFGAGRWTEVAA